MDIGLGIQMILPLAAKEAAAGGASELEPGHFLCAALKLAEMPAAFLHNVLPDKEMVAGIEEDQRGVCKTLEELGIHVPADSTKLRRVLRGVLRNGNREGPKKKEGVVHRSAASKAVFVRAEAAAQQAGERTVTVARMVETLLAEPDEAVAAALAQMGNIRIDARPAAGKEAIAWIEVYGCDLTAGAREKKQDDARIETIHRDAVCRVLAEALFVKPGVKTLPALLVSRGERHAADVVNDLALRMVSSKPPPGAAGGCILEIRSKTILDRKAEGSPEARLEEVIQRAATCKNTVLFFDDFHRYLIPAIAGEGVAHRFQSLLSNAKAACAVGMTQKQYETYIEHAASWRNVFKLIWIHDASPNFQL